MRELLQRSWFPLAVAAGITVLFLAAGASTFPMDDAYIHSVYARNLAEHGRLTFNLNPPDPGLGTTSILWPLLLAALNPLFGVIAAARMIGVLSYLATALLITELARWMTPADDRRTTVYAALLVVLSGNLAWFSFSGMETMLWLAFGLGAVVCYRHRRMVGLGLLLGLMMLTRIEGFVLLGAILIVDVVLRRRLERDLLLSVALALVILSPWLVYVHARTGHWMPTSYSGKKHAQVRAAMATLKQFVGQGHSTVDLDQAKLPFWTIVIYPLAALGYGFAFVAGAAYLPGLRVPFPSDMGKVLGGVSLTGALVMAGLYGPIWWHAFKRAAGVIRRPLPDDRRAALIVLAFWFILHNLAYWLKLPTPGTASRYQVVNHVAWWLLLGAGVWCLPWPRRRQWQVAAVVLVLAAWNMVFWRAVYASDVRHMQSVRLAAADYIRTQLPPDAVIAAHDIGALGWRMDRRCIDLGGLIDPAWLNAARQHRQAEFLREQHADYLVLPTKHSSEAVGFFDYGLFLGIKDNPDIRLEVVRSFEQDYDDWRLGASPTWNALPGVTIYRFVW